MRDRKLSSAFLDNGCIDITLHDDEREGCTWSATIPPPFAAKDVENAYALLTDIVMRAPYHRFLIAAQAARSGRTIDADMSFDEQLAAAIGNQQEGEAT